MEIIHSLGALEAVLTEGSEYWLRYSEGDELTQEHPTSFDFESRQNMDGLSAVSLQVPAWWKRPARDWIARQVSKYAHLSDENPRRRAWIIQGSVEGRGPDQEPLLRLQGVLASLDSAVVQACESHYKQVMDAGRGPEGSEDT